MIRGCLAAILATGAIGIAVAIIAVRNDRRHAPPSGYAGDPDRGRTLVTAYGCSSCHSVGSGATRGMVGPPLDDIGARGYIAGRFPNVPGVMQQWIRAPRELKPGTAMPDLGVSERDADDIAAYLATLR
ncbi:MAG TPA: c-type cytochrome [Thermoanaerobaculia bacterium]|nr:c-type cytochrome [Thermoanaerobaculia bacterium]